MTTNATKLREDLTAIWHAGIEGVNVERLIAECVTVEADNLVIGEMRLPLDRVQKISVIGAGKAAAGMAAAVEKTLSCQIDAGIVAGWVNIPEGCEQSLRVVRQHPARPSGVNEPTETGVAGTKNMLAMIESTNRELIQKSVPLSQHLVLCLISGGGSALMPLPVEGVTLAQKLAVTRFLSATGATINEINTVRKQLSGVKGGRLKRFCRGTTLVSLILSDVLGDPLDVIASGPTVDHNTTAVDAIDVLEKYGFGKSQRDSEHVGNAANEILDFLQKQCDQKMPASVECPQNNADNEGETYHLVIGNNATAVDAAGLEAVKRGYSPTMLCAVESESDVETLATYFVDLARKMSDPNAFGRLTNCLISGGEPTVKLIPADRRGLGGRNQQLVLAVICRLLSDEPFRLAVKNSPDSCRFAFLSGGTDGEDGPTDASGAFFDGQILHQIANSDIDPFDYLARNDAYRFFSQFDALIKTGPTGTNVCDLRILGISEQE